MKTLEVCSNDAQFGIVGYIDVPDHMAAAGKEIIATRADADGLPQPISFQVRENTGGFGAQWPALQADGYDVPTLRMLLAPWNFRTR